MRPESPVNWQTLAGHVTRVVRQLTNDGHRLPSGQFWNVNFPAVAGDDHPEEIRFAPQGTLSHDIGFKMTAGQDDGAVRLLEYAGDFRSRGKTGECDVSVLFGGLITATPIDLCTTAPGWLT